MSHSNFSSPFQDQSQRDHWPQQGEQQQQQQQQQHQQQQQQYQQSRRFSSHNPFRPTSGSLPNNDVKTYLPNTSRNLPLQQPDGQSVENPQSALTADNAFEYRNMNVGSENNPTSAYLPSNSTALSEETVGNWPHSPASHILHSPQSQTSSVLQQQVLHSSSSSSPERPTIFVNPPSPPAVNISPPSSSSTGTSGNDQTLSSNLSMKEKSISFASPQTLDVKSSEKFVIDTKETEEIFDETLNRNKTVMKRHRWGTQRHAKGRPKGTPKRSKSIFGRSNSQRPPNIPSHYSQNGSSESLEHGEPKDAEPHKVFFNLPLPSDMIDPETEAPIRQYARNKIRTAKYSPLSFIPKNLFFQFQNVANIYFLFIVILGAFTIFGVASPGLASVPIIVIIVITAIKDAIEDYRRTVLDLELNNTKTQILSYWHNPNVTDDNISLWRRIKKATSRLIARIAKSIKDSKKKKQDAKNPSAVQDDQFGTELTTSMTIKSIETTNHEMADLSNLNATHLRPMSAMSFAIDDDNNNPFSENNSTGHVGSVINTSRQPPGTARFKHDYWKNVRVGDFIRVHNNDEIPADIVVMATSDSDGACYVETKNLDGETNLKVRQALKCGEGIKHSADCERAQFWIESEQPQANLYTFNGVAKWPQYNSPLYDRETGAEPPIGSESISINNILLRGCSLRNTKWVIGVVVFTGPDTKIIINSGETPSKRSKISRELNFSVICNFVILFILCFLSGVLNGVAFARSSTSITFFEFGSIGGSPAVDGIVTFWAAVILYQSLVPISLYISIEIVKTIQAFFIYSDVFMYYAPLDYPCTPKSWNISDDLGQIEYVFSDKTGTLTQNVMEFKKCTINGVAYGKAYTEALAGMRMRDGIDVEAEGAEMVKMIALDKIAMIDHLRKIHDNPQLVDEELTFVSSEFVNDIEGASGPEQQLANQHFMLALALCHSVISEPSKTYAGRVDFKAQSPDEAALVGAARDVGFSFIDRTNSGVILNIQGMQQEYKILNILEFNSTRKRMSAIIKFPKQGPNGTDRILLICKGADSVIYSRLKDDEQGLLLCQETALHLEQFANEGLRTLCIAQKELSAEEYSKFSRDHEVASSALVNREDRMEEVADALERNLTLLGGTAIEDRLQDGVPQSIALLGRAGIKLWVLTGDKVETAINIGFSCNLLDNEMELLILRTEEHTIQAADALLTEYLDKYFNLTASEDAIEKAKLDHSPPSSHHAVVIDGDTLKLCLDERLMLKFLLLCKHCKSVLCCRVSPAQKAAVVRLVKNSLSVMTLAIGDGANDVAMIQEADVGVGIAGEEGRAAVMSSDYALGQFRFLTRLLLVHGRWSYKRLAEMIPNFFYKNVVFALNLFWYGAFSSFDGAYLFEYTYVMFFNLAFTSVPVILIGVLDQDVEDRISLAVPQLYQRGILGLDWSQMKFWTYMADGLYQSLISFFFPFFTYLGGVSISSNGLQLDHRFWMGLSVCTIAVFSCNLYTLSNQDRWDIVSVIVNIVSSFLVFVWTGIYSSFLSSEELYDLGNQMLRAGSFWAVIFLGIIACLLPHYAIISAQKIFWPADVDIVREKWALGVYDSIPPITEENSGLTAAQALEKQEGHTSRQVSVDSPDSDPTFTNQTPGASLSEEESNYGTSHSKQGPIRTLSKRLSKAEKRASFNKWVGRTSKSGKDLESFEFTDEEDLVSPNFPKAFGPNRSEVSQSYISFDTEQLYPENSFDHNSIVPMSTVSLNSGPIAGSSNATLLPNNQQRSDIRTSLDIARGRIRNEQEPPRESLDNIRMSMDLDDITTAEGLLRVMSHPENLKNEN